MVYDSINYFLYRPYTIIIMSEFKFFDIFNKKKEIVKTGDNNIPVEDQADVSCKYR